MKSFREWLTEKVDMKNSKLFKDRVFPISIGAKNITHSRKELADNLEQSYAIDSTELIRATYDVKAKKMYVWWAKDGIHLDIKKMFNLKKPIEIRLDPKTKKVQMQLDNATEEGEREVDRFFGVKTV